MTVFYGELIETQQRAITLTTKVGIFANTKIYVKIYLPMPR